MHSQARNAYQGESDLAHEYACTHTHNSTRQLMSAPKRDTTRINGCVLTLGDAPQAASSVDSYKRNPESYSSEGAARQGSIRHS
jgi:hypothetical protein